MTESENAVFQWGGGGVNDVHHVGGVADALLDGGVGAGVIADGQMGEQEANVYSGMFKSGRTG